MSNPDTIMINRPKPDYVMFVVTAVDGATATVEVHKRLILDSNLTEYLTILRDGQAAVRARRES